MFVTVMLQVSSVLTHSPIAGFSFISDRETLPEKESFLGSKLILKWNPNGTNKSEVICIFCRVELSMFHSGLMWQDVMSQDATLERVEYLGYHRSFLQKNTSWKLSNLVATLSLCLLFYIFRVVVKNNNVNTGLNVSFTKFMDQINQV